MISQMARRRSAAGLAAAVLVAGILAPGSAARAAITPAAGVWLIAANSNKCVNVASASLENSASVIQYTCSESATNDKWRTVPVGDGSYEIVAVHSGKCLNVQGGGTDNSLAIIQFTCTALNATTKNDKWKPEPVNGTNRFRLRVVSSNKCLNVQGGGTANSLKLIQFTCQTTVALNEQFYFPPATATPPAVPVEQDSATNVLQAKPAGTGLGALEYAYTDNLGRLRHGRQVDPSRFDLVEWTTVSGNQAYSGKPSLGQRSDGRVQTVVHNGDSDMWLFSQTAAGAATWDAGTDFGGSTAGRPTLARLESGELVAFAVDSAGRVWRCSLNSSPAPFMDWRLVGGSGLAGPVTAALTTTGLRLFARDAGGAVQTATYTSGALSDWTSLGGSGFTDQPAVVIYPGYRLRIFVRAADGTIQTKIQNASGVFDTDWQPVGTLVTTGSPAAILDPTTGRTAVVVRGTDNEVYRVFESGQLTGAWGDWARISPDVSDPTVTDVTVAPYTGAGGETWLVAFRNVNDTTRVYERQVPAAAAAKSARTAGTPSFSGHSLPVPADATRKDTPR